eukprot:765065-Hanusia_phi.AAC.7
MQSSHLVHELGSRLHKQVVRVHEHQFATCLVCCPMVHSLQCPVGPHRHEAWRVDDAVGCVDSANAGKRLLGLVHELIMEEIPLVVCPGGKVSSRRRRSKGVDANLLLPPPLHLRRALRAFMQAPC